MLHDLKLQLQKWLRRRRDVAVLRQFDDHLLADIGVERDDIAARVHARSEAPGLKRDQQNRTAVLRFHPATYP